MARSSISRLFSRKSTNGATKERKLRPLDPSRPCAISKLPDDIVLQIFDLVQATSSRSMLRLASVHPHFYHLARYTQHRSVTVDLGRAETAAKQLELIEKHGLLPAIHELRVLCRFGKVDDDCLARLGDLVARMTGLRNLHWEYAPIPAAVLKALPRLPFNARLHVVVRDERGRSPAPRLLLATLESCAALVSLRLETQFYHAEDCRSLTQPLKTLLLTCPNLADLSIDLHLPRQGCVGFAQPQEYCGLGFAHGERPQRAWCSLAIHQYAWGYPRAIDAFGFEGYPGDGLETEYWADTFDWSALTRFEDTSPTQLIFANTLGPRLTALREAAFTQASDLRGNSLQTFFMRVPSMLASIDVPTLGPVGVDAVLRHAPALRRLVIHQPERSSETWVADLVKHEELGRLCDGLPHLEELGLDVMRVDNDWPRKIFSVLAQRAHSLRVLELWFGLGDFYATSPPRPVLKASSAVQLFTDLRHGCASLEQVRLHSGCPAPLGLGLPADSAYYPEQNSASFVCQISERDDGAAAGRVVVTNTRLSPRLNDRMDRILRGIERREDVEGNLIALQVALDGPMKYASWTKWREQW